jgi:hypothetical protein
MNLDELEADERIALVALVLAMVDADTAKTDEEMKEFRAIAADVGRREFDEAFRHRSELDPFGVQSEPGRAPIQPAGWAGHG